MRKAAKLLTFRMFPVEILGSLLSEAYCVFHMHLLLMHLDVKIYVHKTSKTRLLKMKLKKVRMKPARYHYVIMLMFMEILNSSLDKH